jgi:ABC-2 type transport system permease protein
MLIYATFSLLEFLVSITFERSLMHYLPLELRDGTFDFALVRPLSPLFYIAFGAIDFFDIFSMIPTIVLIGYVFATAPPTPAGLLWYLIFIGVAYFFVFAVMILISVSAFWTTRTSGLGRLFEYTRQTTRFPLTTFPRAAQFTLFYIFPVALISLVPALAYLGRLSLSNGFYLVIFTAVIFAVSLRVWRWGLRRYESASS